MGNTFTNESSQRIAQTVIEWERANSRRLPPPRPKRSTRGELPNWNAIANEDIASESTGTVVLADANRTTTGTDTIVGYNGGPAIANGRPVLVFPMALPRYDGGEPVNWQIVDPNPQCGGQPILADLECGLLATGTTSQRYEVSIDASKFEARPGGDQGYMAVIGDTLQYVQDTGQLCRWDTDRVDGTGFGYHLDRYASADANSQNFRIRQHHAEVAPYVYDIILASDPQSPQFDGLVTRDLKFSSEQPSLVGSQPNAGIKLLDTVQVGDVIGSIAPYPRAGIVGTPCEILADHANKITDHEARISAIESQLGIGPVQP